ncbi:MAG: LamG domain-containing protein, partial [Sedimentisphaerales bacterium]|nr:LamG domain-containing protein [Sedimentisphaerales bacterium]
YDSRVDRTFTTAQNWEVNEFVSLSILIQGKVGNAEDDIYVEVEDQSTNSDRVYINDTNVVDAYMWYEVAVPFSAFSGVDMDEIKRLSIGVGSETPASSGTGTIRIDTIRLYPTRCFTTYAADFDDDCKVDLSDYAVIADEWMDEYAEVIEPVEPDPCSVTAYWDFNEDSGDTAYDSSGNNRNATLVYCNWQPDSGKENGAVEIYRSTWNQNDGRVEFPASAITLPAGTFSAWLYLDSSQSSPTTRYIFGHTSLPVYHDRIQLYMDGGNTELDCGMGETHALITGIATLPTEQWLHVAMSWDGTTVRVYVNGIEEASSGYSNVDTIQDMAQLGNTGISSPTERFRGMFDEVSFYNTALTPGEILYLAEGDPILEISEPRETDLYLDGVIDLKDLEVFGLWWLENSLWP